MVAVVAADVVARKPREGLVEAAGGPGALSPIAPVGIPTVGALLVPRPLCVTDHMEQTISILPHCCVRCTEASFT